MFLLCLKGPSLQNTVYPLYRDLRTEYLMISSHEILVNILKYFFVIQKQIILHELQPEDLDKFFKFFIIEVQLIYNAVLVSGVQQSDSVIHIQRERKIAYDITYMWNLKKMIQMNLFTKQKQTHRYKKQTWLPKGRGGRINQESGIIIYTLLYIKQVNNKDLLYSTGNYTQYLVITCN